MAFCGHGALWAHFPHLKVSLSFRFLAQNKYHSKCSSGRSSVACFEDLPLLKPLCWTGPYWNGVQGTPSERLLHGLQIHHSQFDAGPDFLVVSSNLWDLWHWGTSNVSLLNDKRIASKELSAWGPHLTQVLEQVEVRQPLFDIPRHMKHIVTISVTTTIFHQRVDVF